MEAFALVILQPTPRKNLAGFYADTVGSIVLTAFFFPTFPIFRNETPTMTPPNAQNPTTI